MISELSHFDNPTGFAAAVNSVSAGLNNRKEFLVDLGVLNKVGLKQDGFEITTSGELRIGGVDLAEINATLRSCGAGDLTLIPTATFRREMGTAYPKLSATGVNLINPAPIPRLLGDKARQYWELHDSSIPVPPWQPIDHYARSHRVAAVESLKGDFIDDAPLVLKPRDATQGRGIWFYPGGVTDVADDWLTETAPDAFLEAPERYLLQYAVPHVCDKRVLAAGRTPVAGENRYGSPATDRSNLSLVETDSASLRETVVELVEMGAVEPLALDSFDPAVRRAVGTLHETLRDLTGLDEDLHTWVGWDFLVVDPEDDRLDAVPENVLEHLLADRYRTERGYYLVFGEGNLSPGSKERYVNAIAHGREGLSRDSAANLLTYGTSISRGKPFDTGIPDPISPETLADRYGL